MDLSGSIQVKPYLKQFFDVHVDNGRKRMANAETAQHAIETFTVEVLRIKEEGE